MLVDIWMVVNLCQAKKKHELDKTLAEYDSNNLVTNSEFHQTNQDLTSDKKKLFANDANAASIRTRVPVRKPGLNNDIFNGIYPPPPPPPPPPPAPPLSNQLANHLTQQKKTLSVPNLYNLSTSSSSSSSSTTSLNQYNTNTISINHHSIGRLPPPPPPPPPPPAPPIPPLPSQYCKSSSNHIYSIPTNSFTNNIDVSASSDTLVLDPSIIPSISEDQQQINEYSSSNKHLNNLQIDYESHNDYDQEEEENNHQKLHKPTHEPATNYHNTQSIINTNKLVASGSSSSSSSSSLNQMSTFNNKMSNNLVINNKNVGVVNNESINQSSTPLTPRQIKQRNSAKRNSIPRSISSTPSSNHLTYQQENINKQHSQMYKLTQQQQRDLLFLQTQKFETEFLQTTHDLFQRYPNAKISISVLLAGQQSTSRQIEIDRWMFEMLCSFQNIKIQPETPIRTTSIQQTNNHHQISTNLANNVITNACSLSSTSPSSVSSSSSSSYDTNDIVLTPKSDDLSEAIKKAAAEHIVKRQMSAQFEKQHSETKPPPTFKEARSFSISSSNTHKSYSSSAMNVKNELERAIETRLRKTNAAIQLQEQLEIENEQKQSTKILVDMEMVSTTTPAAAAALEAAKLENLNKRNVPRDPPPPLPVSAQINKLNNQNNFSIKQHELNLGEDLNINLLPPPPAPPLPSHFVTSLQLANTSTSSNASFPPPPSPTQLNRLSKTVGSANNLSLITNRSIATPPPPPPPLTFLTNSNKQFTNDKQKVPIDSIGNHESKKKLPKPVLDSKHSTNISTMPTQSSSNNNVKSIINIYQQSPQIIDPRTSSDFGALIAKKAAEKRAKFQDLKPQILNAVTFQDGSKIFTNSISQPSNNRNPNNNKVEKIYQSTNMLILKNNNDLLPKKYTHSSTLNLVNFNYHHDNNNAYLVNNNNASSNNNDNLSNEDNKDSISTDMNVNRNESFINTAAKLLERAKQQHQNQHQQKQKQEEDENGKLFTSTTIAKLSSNVASANISQPNNTPINCER